MIVDSLNNCKLYESVHKDFSRVFEVLKRFSNEKNFYKIVLDEGNVWVNEPCLINVEIDSKLFEAHRNFIDIHYVISGTEAFGYSNIEYLEAVSEYDPEKDCELLDGKKEFITLKAGDFCVVFPQDAHIPAMRKIGNDELVKVVAKIRY